eukprot:CFRG2419T1
MDKAVDVHVDMEEEREVRLVPALSPTPNAIETIHEMCQEITSKENCLPVRVVVADIHRYLRDPLVYKAITTPFESENPDIFDITLCETASTENRIKAVLSPDLYQQVYKNQLRAGTLVHINEVKFYLADEKNSSKLTNVMIILGLRVLGQGYKVGFDSSLLSNDEQLWMATPLLGSRLYYIAFANNTDFVPTDPRWARHLQETRPQSIQITHYEDILKLANKSKLPPLYGRVISKSRLIHTGISDLPRAAPVQAHLVIVDAKRPAARSDAPRPKFRVVLWETTCCAFYNGIHVGDVVCVEGYRLKCIYGPIDDDEGLCGLEVSVNSRNPKATVRRIVPDPTRKNITKFLKRFPMAKYNFAWPDSCKPKEKETMIDLIGIVLYVGRKLITVGRSNNNSITLSEYRWIQIRHPVQPTKTVSIRLYALSNPEDTQIYLHEGPWHKHTQSGRILPSIDRDGEQTRIHTDKRVRIRKSQRVRTDTPASRMSTRSQPQHAQESSPTPAITQRITRRMAHAHSELQPHDSDGDVIDNPNRRRTMRRNGMKKYKDNYEHSSGVNHDKSKEEDAPTGVSGGDGSAGGVVNRRKRKNKRGNDDLENALNTRTMDPVDVFSTRHGRRVIEWAAKEEIKALVSRCFFGGPYIPMPLPNRYEFYCAGRSDDEYNPRFDITEIDTVIVSARKLRYRETQRFVVRGTVVRLELKIAQRASRPDTGIVYPTSRKIEVQNVPIPANHLATSISSVYPDILENETGNVRVPTPKGWDGEDWNGPFWIMTVQNFDQDTSIEVLIPPSIEQQQLLLCGCSVRDACGPGPLNWIRESMPRELFDVETRNAMQDFVVDEGIAGLEMAIAEQLRGVRLRFVLDFYQGNDDNPEILLLKTYPIQIFANGDGKLALFVKPKVPEAKEIQPQQNAMISSDVP